MKKFISMFLVTLMSIVSLISVTGCGSVVEKIDKNKTQLYVNVLNKGVGTDFAYSLKDGFEAKYAGETFEDGKTGVQVIITTDEVDKDGLTSALQSDSVDIFYLINFPIKDYVTADGASTSEYLEDITDIVAPKVNGVIKEDSIHNKLFESSREYFNVGTSESPKYFALPWFTSYLGTVYDIGLFKEYHLYSTDPDKNQLLQYKGLDGVVSEDDNWGPDGKTGTEIVNGIKSDYTLDDGLPATWDDFKLLMGVMQAEEITPFVFTAGDGYPESWLQALWIDYEGKDNYELVKSFDGTYTYKDGMGITQTLQISESNGYEVAYQQGKRTAIAVGEQLIRNTKWVDPVSFDSNTTNKVAQEVFLRSNTERPYSGSNGKPIAFLMEGTWWENESKSTFDYLENAKFGGEEYAYGVREFGYFPFPKFTKGTQDFNASANTDKITLRSGGVGEYASSVLINKKSKKKDLAKLFLEYAYSDEMNIDFTIKSGVSKPMQYQMAEADLANLTPFQRNIFQYTQNSNVEVVSGANRSKYMVKAPDDVKAMVEFSAKIGTETVKGVLSAFRNNANLTSAQYWQGVKANGFEQTWAQIIG